MTRTVLLPVLGAIAGVVGMYAWLYGTEPPADRALAGPGAVPTAAATRSSASPGDAPAEGALASSVAPGLARDADDQVSGLLAVYETAALTDDVEALERLLTEAARRPEGRARSTRINALLVRLAELDPRRALGLARSLYLETRFVEVLFQTWAAADPDAALVELGRLSPAGTQRSVALALLDVFGNDPDGLERVSAELPAADRLSFAVDALVARAEHEPMAALEAALSFETPHARQIAVREVAAAVARLSPQGALAYADSIENDELRNIYTSSVLATWATLDPGGVFDYLEVAEPRNLRDIGFLSALAASDPERLLTLGERLPPNHRLSVQFYAFQSLAERDPLAAWARMDELPPGTSRDMLLRSVAQSYGRREPDAALAWARGLTPPSMDAVGAVIGGIAAVDADRALDLYLRELADPGIGGQSGIIASMPAIMILQITANAGTTDMGRLLNRLTALEDPQLRSGVPSVLSRWGQTDPEAALRWVIDNADTVESQWLSNLAANSIRRDGQWALAAADRLPADVRDGWMAGLVRGMAQSDPETAVRLLGRIDSASEAQGVARTLGGSWAQRDPAAASAWARGLDDADLQRNAVGGVANTWARTDADATRRWITTLPSGAARDTAIDAYLPVAAQRGTLDTRLLDAYSSEGQRQQGASRAILVIGRNNVDDARRLMDAHITDSGLRRQLEQQLARMGGGGSNPFPFILP